MALRDRFPRWCAGVGGALLVALALAAMAGAPPRRRAGQVDGARSAAGAAPDPDAPAVRAAARADRATEALLRRYWDPAAGTFRSGDAGGQAQYWVGAQALDAVLDGYERTRDPRWRAVAEAFVSRQARRGFQRPFFDDEGWMALALLRFHDLTGDPAALARAEDLLGDIAAGARDGAAPGLWWDRAHTQKATAANAGPALAAALVYERTGDLRWLAFAREVFGSWVARMVDPATGQVADHLDAGQGRIWWRFTYNEGTMIGAALALHRLTADPRYLAVARRLGAFVLARERSDTPSGPVLSDGPGCAGDCELFKGIAARYLAELAAVDPAGPWAGAVASSAAGVWQLARDGSGDVFGERWGGPPGHPDLSTQIAAVMELASAARLAARLQD